MVGKTISHYCILEKLGEGGMGVVYKAEDTKLKRKVVLKFLSPHLTADKDATERYEREAQAAAALNHPNIITVYEISEHKDRIFIAMEYVDGASLREKISPSEKDNCRLSIANYQLTINEIIHLVTQICEGLFAAHQAGIIHRDIKPENILIDKSGRVKILDFGLARMKGVTKLTKDASTLGTLKYMSPEQYQNKEVDHRSDIWSFGVVLYEMLTGQLPFQGEYEAAVMYSVVNEEPISVSSVRKDTPQNLERIVSKSFEKDPPKRYQSMQEVLEGLSKPISSITESELKEKSIVVLPFENMSPDPDQEYFSDGLTEEIITDLSQIHTLRVISRNSAMRLKGTQKDTKTIGRELNVEYLLEGSVRKAGNNLRIIAQLIDAVSDKHLWAEKYSGTLDDIFDIQEKVSRSIVDALKLKLSSDEVNQLSPRSSQDLKAYEYYLQARSHYWHGTKKSYDEALDLVKRGLQITGENDLLYCLKGEIYVQLVNILSVPPKTFPEYLKKAQQCVEKALKHNPNSGNAHFLQGFIFHQSGNPKGAICHLQKAISLDPNHAFALYLLGFQLAAGGCHLDQAQGYLEKSRELDPLNSFYQGSMGWFHMFNGNYRGTLEAFREMGHVVEVNKSPFLIFFIWFSATSGDFEEAYRLIHLVEREMPGHVAADLSSFLKHVWRGEKQHAMNSVTEQLELAAKWDDIYSYLMAIGYSFIGEIDRAFPWLEHSINYGFTSMKFFESDSFLENLRSDDRYRKLMERAKHLSESLGVPL